MPINGTVIAIYIGPIKRQPMQLVQEVEAIARRGLKGDRYFDGNGSYNQGESSKRQVTLINARFFKDSGFEFIESRRNIVVQDVELNWLSEKRVFQIGQAHFRGVSYCDPCDVPSNSSGNCRSFKETFYDCGGIIAEVTHGGIIKIGDLVIPPPKKY